MSISNLQNLFSIDYPTVATHENGKIIGPVNLPITIANSRKGKMECYLYTGKENYLVCLFGENQGAENVLVRISSACVFGFILNSLLCDCKNQFDEAIDRMDANGPGILIFALDQHGKGIGIEAHFLVYAEGQRRQRGLFTEIYKDLGLNYDYRDYTDVLEILNHFKQTFQFKKITMLTESPEKRDYFAEKCKELNIEIDFERFNTPVTAENYAELSEKVAIGYEIFNYKESA